MKDILIFLTLSVFASCSSGVSEKSISREDSIRISKNKPKVLSKNDSLLLFVKKLLKAEFKRSRQDMIDQNFNKYYTVSEIDSSGNSFGYHIDYVNFNATQNFLCTPDMGESIMSFMGEKGAVDTFYRQTKLSTKWKPVEKAESGESFESFDRWDDKPLTTHITMTYTVDSEDAMLIMNRKLLFD